MNKYKVYVYAICKNEVQFVDKWINSMSEADEMVVTDTGSTDGTIEKLIERGATVYTEVIEPWRFDTARNLSLEHVPKSADICVCTDLDELFVKGWRTCLENVWTTSTKTANYIYNWSLNADGTPDVQFHYFKAHARHDYIWSYPIHECLKYIGSEYEEKVFVPDMILNHHPDKSKSRGSYLPLLEMAIAEAPQDNRMNYYLGREYMYNRMWDKCIEVEKHYLALPSSFWKEERSAAMRCIAESFYELSSVQEAYNWYYKAIAECPSMREPYIECAKVAYSQSNWEMVLFMVQEALKIQQKSTCFVNMGYCWDHTPYDLLSICCYWLGMYEKALFYVKEALLYCPHDSRLLNNLAIIERKSAYKPND